MAIIADKYYNLLDYSQQFAENGDLVAVADVLAKANPMIDDAVLIESNSDAGHLHAIQTSIPEGTWRRAYKGVPYEKGTQKQIMDTYGTLAANSLVDKIIAEKGGKINEVRTRQAKTIIEGMGQTMGKSLIYGSLKKNEESFVGLAAHYATAGGAWTANDSSRNVVKAGSGSSNANTSVYLVNWDTDKIFTFFPKGSKAGLQHIDYTPNGKPEEVLDSSGNSFPGYKDYFEWQLGLCVHDWRYGGRVCNIVAATTGAELRSAMDEMIARVDKGTGKQVLYMNKATAFKLQQALDNKGNVYYTPAQPNQPAVLMYSGIPVHVCEFIASNEATLA